MHGRNVRRRVTAHFDDDAPGSPIALECSKCEAEHIVFDDSKHGHDGAVGNNEPLEREAIIDELASEEIGPPHHVLMRFEFPSEHLDDDEWRGREQDLFSWLTIVARDPASGRLAFLFEQECA